MSTIALTMQATTHLTQSFYYAPVSDNSTPINNSRYFHGTVPMLQLIATQLLVAQQDLGFISSTDNRLPSRAPKSALSPSYSLI